MTTMTLTPTRRTTWPIGLALGCVAGTALVISGVWNVLIQEHVTVAAPPEVRPEVPPAQMQHTYYAWFASTVSQDRGSIILGLIGVSGLVILAAELRRHLNAGLRADLDLGRHPGWGRGACVAMQVGGPIWMVGALVAIGGHRAVGLMATHDNPIQTVNAIAFTTDMTSDAFSAASFILLALAMLGLASTSFGGHRWAALSVLIGALAAFVADGYLASIDSITSYGLGVLAGLLLPIWLVWTGVLLDRAARPA